MLLPPAGPQRILAIAAFVNTVGRGIFLTAGVLYFTLAVHLPAKQVGLGLSISGTVALAAGIPIGHLADRCGARGTYLVTLLCGATAMAALTLIHEFWSFLAIASFGAAAQSASIAARGPIIAQHGGERPQELRGYLRSVTNVGISIGALLAGWAIQIGSRTAFSILLLGTAGAFLACVAIIAHLPRVPPQSSTNTSWWKAIGDPPYLVLTVLDGLLALQFKILTVAVPLWLVAATAAPTWLISGTMVVNTLIVGVFQVRASRHVTNPNAAGRAMRRAGAMFLVSCTVISFSAGIPGWIAAAMLLSAVIIHSVGELWHAAGGFELSFALAPPYATGQYQGLFGMGLGVAEAAGPALLTALCIEWGPPGWYVIGILLALTGLAVPTAVRWAQHASRYQPST